MLENPVQDQDQGEDPDLQAHRELSPEIGRFVLELAICFCTQKSLDSIRQCDKSFHEIISKNSLNLFFYKEDLKCAAYNLSDCKVADTIDSQIDHNKYHHIKAQDTYPYQFLLTQSSKWVSRNDQGQWHPSEPPTTLVLTGPQIETILSHPQAPSWQQSYFFLKTRAQRHAVVMNLLSVLEDPYMLQSMLRGQSIRDLRRLQISLRNYTDPSIKAVAEEVEGLIQARFEKVKADQPNKGQVKSSCK